MTSCTGTSEVRSRMSKPPGPVVLSVHYGDPVRWASHRLQQVEEAIGRSCRAFDGLTAEFEFDTEQAAMGALLVMRNLGFRAETMGIGQGPCAAAAAEAVSVARELYRRKFGDGP